MNVAIIPARGGSKRIPRKNIKPFFGKPLISYSIEVAKASELFDKILVSTDCDEIAKIAEECGAEVPFKRPENLSNDHATTDQVLIHALEWLGKFEFTNACCIYPTAPLLAPEFLKMGLETLNKQDSTSVISVTSMPCRIQRAFKIASSGNLELFWPEHRFTRSQDLEEAFMDAGQFYWVNIAKYLKEGRLYSDNSSPVLLPRNRVQDIDTMEDWEMAEFMFKILSKEKNH